MPRLLIGNIKGTKGDTGAQGERGLAGTIEIGSVQTVSYGSPASVTNSGTEEEAILDFQIPQGAPGATVTDMRNLVLGAITDSTADYPAFAVNETGSTIFGKIRKFLSDLKNNYVSKVMMTTSTNVDTAGQAVADAKAIKSLNDSLSNFTAVTDGGNNYVHWYKTGNIVTVRIQAPTVTEANKWVELGTLPNGCKPKATIPFVCYDNNANSTDTSIVVDSQVTTDGRVLVYLFKTGVEPYGTITYVVS